jgi:hypothetical protein
MADPITRSGSYYTAPRDANRVPTLLGVSTADGITPVPVEVNPSTGQLQVNTGAGGGLPTAVVYGQKAVTATAAVLPTAALTEGVIITGLSTNTISVFIGDASVTTATGVELQPGAALSAAISNLNKLYVIASTTGATVTWLGS